MKKTVWEEREKAFEDKYFRDLEREQLRKLREKNAQQEDRHNVDDVSDSSTEETRKGTQKSFSTNSQGYSPSND
ncbi:MAG: hypothetical protein LC645_05340 [Geobacteraceae bacterium]|nr:hypothetical protein [Geobacteraceae bacterium]